MVAGPVGRDGAVTRVSVYVVVIIDCDVERPRRSLAGLPAVVIEAPSKDGAVFLSDRSMELVRVLDDDAAYTQGLHGVYAVWEEGEGT